MAGIAELYEERLRVGKKTPLGKGLKLGYNSAYGKTAQSIGMPVYGNAIYASLITAGCRAMILDAIATHPGGQTNVAMVATDGVYFLDPHPGLPLSSRLGEWDLTVHEKITLFKPGVYWDEAARIALREGKAPKFKARGINSKDLAKRIDEIDEIFASWPKLNKDGTARNMCDRPQWKPKGSGWPMVKVKTSFSMVSMLQAIQPGWDWERAGEVRKGVEATQSAGIPHAEKRYGLWYDSKKDVYRSVPVWMIGQGFGSIDDPNPSTPYEKKFGREDPWSDLSMEYHGITPDGTVSDNLANALMTR
jgi:hypothetical protein